MAQLYHLVILFMVLITAEAAYRGPACPSSCRCLHFEGLQSVYCNRTGINAVPSGIPPDTQLLDLSENNIERIALDDLKGLKYLQELDLSSNRLDESSIESRALDLTKLVTIDLSFNLYKSIPKSLPANISKLWFFNNNVQILKSDSFLNYTNLQYVDLSNNNMVAIEKGAFDPLLFLQTLYIPFNNLTDESIPPGTFNGSTNLQLLSVRFNLLQHMFKYLPCSLQYLDYVGNKIITIPAYSFVDLPNLQTLSFWEGQVTTIEDNAFFGLSKLKILDMNMDKLSSAITNNTFAGLTNLQTCYMYSNSISRLDIGALYHFTSLSELWLQGNKMSTLRPEVLDVKYIPKLSQLYIDSNPWYCDCHLRWLREKVDKAPYVIQDTHLIVCAGPENLAGKAWDVLKPSDFVCPS
ncbi:slit homolog 3 protein-like [Ruditapes philippinarum]|uniref:slit homolog 3 protein-like n=1 Tax=Ruditapes philippinarum TaxID=129788 RepID=UPI00295AA479|nr:slit homolog 3 protein-like [Ruditapes philippinarum]